MLKISVHDVGREAVLDTLNGIQYKGFISSIVPEPDSPRGEFGLARFPAITITFVPTERTVCTEDSP